MLVVKRERCLLYLALCFALEEGCAGSAFVGSVFMSNSVGVGKEIWVLIQVCPVQLLHITSFVFQMCVFSAECKVRRDLN